MCKLDSIYWFTSSTFILEFFMQAGKELWSTRASDCDRLFNKIELYLK
jgi:hypothetical protein